MNAIKTNQNKKKISDNTNQNKKNLVVGLKTQVKRQVSLKNFENKKFSNALSAVFNAWREIRDNGLTHLLDTLIWTYIENLPSGLYKEMNSGLLAITTTIADYTTKTGKVNKAHYTANGKYLGSTKNLGDKPVYYDGHFKINKEDFLIDENKLDGLENLADLFVTCKIAPKKNKTPARKFIIEEDLE
jgi:hypothetical protein